MIKPETGSTELPSEYIEQFFCQIWLREASIAAFSRRLGLSWNTIVGIMQRAVHRGLVKRTDVEPKRLGVDETSFRKCHDYVTVITDQEAQRVLHVADARDLESLSGFYDGLSGAQKAAKVRSRGFRNKGRFHNAIYFHHGGLDLYPDGIKQQGLPTRSGEDPFLITFVLLDMYLNSHPRHLAMHPLH